jgi:predicted phosphodiesterase
MITVIGDVHGKYKRYHEIIRETERHPYTVQLGDFGFDYGTVFNVDDEKHKIIGGNHDHYGRIIHIPHYLGDFGYSCLNGVSFFYYRGAYSIDQKYRTVGIDWWPEEQVNVEGFMKARELYRATKPDIVITHDCPESISPYLLNPGAQIFQNQTGYFLQEFFNIHQPKMWLFGHYHRSWKMNINGTDFQCLNELEHTKIP